LSTAAGDPASAQPFVHSWEPADSASACYFPYSCIDPHPWSFACEAVARCRRHLPPVSAIFTSLARKVQCRRRPTGIYLSGRRFGRAIAAGSLRGACKEIHRQTHRAGSLHQMSAFDRRHDLAIDTRPWIAAHAPAPASRPGTWLGSCLTAARAGATSGALRGACTNLRAPSQGMARRVRPWSSLTSMAPRSAPRAAACFLALQVVAGRRFRPRAGARRQEAMALPARRGRGPEWSGRYLSPRVCSANPFRGGCMWAARSPGRRAPAVAGEGRPSDGVVAKAARHRESRRRWGGRIAPAERWQQPAARVLARWRRLRPLDDQRLDAAGVSGAPNDAPRRTTELWLARVLLSRFRNPR